MSILYIFIIIIAITLTNKLPKIRQSYIKKSSILILEHLCYEGISKINLPHPSKHSYPTSQILSNPHPK